RVLDEYAAIHEPLGDLPSGPAGGVDVDARPEPGDAHGRHAMTDEGLQSRFQMCAESPGALLELAGLQHPDDRQSDGCGQRIAAEGRSVLAGTDDAEHI